VLSCALATDIDSRYQSASEFSDALRTVAHKTGLAFSAPELAAHLREILGSDPDRWLRDEGTPMADAAKVPAQSVGLVGKEAASIGLVPEGAEDEPPPLVLSPNAVSGSKDFDLDSMLNDEATRPGLRGRGPAVLSSPEPGAPEAQALRRGEPPPVWTRSSGPVPIVTPPPARATSPGRVVAPPAAAARPAPPPPPATQARAVPPPPVTAPAKAAPVAPPRSTSTGMRAAAPLPPPPPVPMAGRIAPRATQRGIAAVPPPFPSAARAGAPPPAPRASAQLPVPPPPPRPAIQEETPPPPEETPPPPYDPNAYAEQAAPAYGGQAYGQPAYGGVPHAQTLHGFGGGLPVGRPPAMAPSYPAPAPAPVPRMQPQMIDFSGSATLPEKSSGPPRWLAVIAIVGSLAGGAVLARRTTEGQMAAVAAFDDVRPARPHPTTIDEKSLPPRAAEPAPEPAVEAMPPAEPPPPAAAAPAAHRAPKPAARARAAAKHHAPPAHRKPGRH